MVENHLGIGAVHPNFPPQLVLRSTEDTGILGELLGDLNLVFTDKLGSGLLSSNIHLSHNNSPFQFYFIINKELKKPGTSLAVHSSKP